MTIPRHTLSCIFGVSRGGRERLGAALFQDCAVLPFFFALQRRLLLLPRFDPEVPEPARLLSISGKSSGRWFPYRRKLFGREDELLELVLLCDFVFVFRCRDFADEDLLFRALLPPLELPLAPSFTFFIVPFPTGTLA